MFCCMRNITCWTCDVLPNSFLSLDSPDIQSLSLSDCSLSPVWTLSASPSHPPHPCSVIADIENETPRPRSQPQAAPFFSVSLSQVKNWNPNSPSVTFPLSSTSEVSHCIDQEINLKVSYLFVIYLFFRVYWLCGALNLYGYCDNGNYFCEGENCKCYLIYVLL